MIQVDSADFPRGPETRYECMRSVELQLDSLPEPHVASMLQKLSNPGLVVCTDYSGLGQPEYALKRIQDWAYEKHACKSSVEFQRSGDLLPEACKVLAESSPRSTCVFGDMMKRMPKDINAKLNEILQRHRTEQELSMSASVGRQAKQASKRASEKKYLAEAKKLILDEDPAVCTQWQSWCKKHKAMCHVHKFKGTGRGHIRMSIAGITCVDWSSRGIKKGTLGKSCMAFTAYMREVIHTLPDVVLLECVRQYQEGDAILMLEHNYHYTGLVFSPSEIGLPIERYRKFMVFLLRSGSGKELKWKEGLQLCRGTFLAAFGRTKACNGHVFMDGTPDHCVSNAIAQKAAHKFMPPRDQFGRLWTFRDFLTEKTGCRIDKYERILQSACSAKSSGRADDMAETESGDEDASAPGSLGSWPVFCDISQEPGFADIVANVPAFTRRNRIWSLEHNRHLLLEEAMEVMGVPAIMPAQTLGLTAPWPESKEELSESKVRALLGNSMQLTAIATVIVYILAFTDEVE